MIESEHEYQLAKKDLNKSRDAIRVLIEARELHKALIDSISEHCQELHEEMQQYEAEMQQYGAGQAKRAASFGS